MTPEYLERLADLADPDKLWAMPVLDQRDCAPLPLGGACVSDP